MDLRFRGIGVGSSSRDSAHASLRYTNGSVRSPERALYIEQGAGTHEPFAEYSVIINLLGNYAPRQDADPLRFREVLNRDWNMERVLGAPRDKMNLTVGGTTVQVEIAYWKEPYPVLLAQLLLEDNPLSVASLNLSRPELADVLGALVKLGEDPETLAEHV